jgi:hypothetical protein
MEFIALSLHVGWQDVNISFHHGFDEEGDK